MKHDIFSAPILTISLAGLITIMCAGPAEAHVLLDKPAGGETLVAGTVFTIMFRETVEHGPVVFELEYTTAWPNGPWNVIASGIPRGEPGETMTYDWTVPETPSNQVRVRVRQVNQGVDYDDVCKANVKIVTAADLETVEVAPSRDATLHEESGDLANGSGSFLFTGLTAVQNDSAERRALVAFDIAAAIPAGATIMSVSLDLQMSKTRGGSQTVELRRVTEDWSEGSSNPSGSEGGGTTAVSGDTTWEHRAYPDTMWTTEGGSFSATASGSQSVDGNGSYTWSSTSQMVADVQDWLDNPSANHGWLLLVPSGSTGSAKRFNSREDGSSPPQLTVSYENTVTAPSAGFTFEPVNPKVGETVTFTDQSTGSPTAWSWDFDDGGDSTEQNPTHTFAAAGTYSVGLTASNDGGDDTATVDVTVVEGEPELTEMILVPGVANAPGLGSVFVTMLDVLNRGPTTATFRLLWLPRDEDNSDPEESAMFMLSPGEVRRFDNVLADAFDKVEVVGAVAVVSDSEDLEAMSRTFNDDPAGTFGQGVPGVPTDELVQAGSRVAVMLLSQNADVRSNLGLVSGVDFKITVRWELFSADGESLETGKAKLDPLGNVQINRVLRRHAPIEAAWAVVWTDTSGGAFTCYGSVLDNATSDPTTVLPR